MSASSWAYLSYGDASDNCSFSVDNTNLTQTIFNCDDLTIDAGVTLQWDSTVSSPIQFRVQGVAQINGTIRVSARDATSGPGGGTGTTSDCEV